MACSLVEIGLLRESLDLWEVAPSAAWPGLPAEAFEYLLHLVAARIRTRMALCARIP